MRGTRATLALTLTGLLCGCPGGGSETDAGHDGGSCSTPLVLGMGGAESFEPLSDGDPVELVLGFQGFRMMELSARAEEMADEEEAEVTVFVDVPATGASVSQHNRYVPLAAASEGGLVIERYLVFFNDVPASEVIGYEADVEMIVRAGGCTAAARRTIVLRDDDDCVVFDAGIPDASVSDGGVPPDAMACGEER